MNVGWFLLLRLKSIGSLLVKLILYGVVNRYVSDMGVLLAPIQVRAVFW